MKTFFTLIITLILFTSSQAQKSDLALNLKKGKEYIQKSDSKATITQEVNGLMINMEMTIRGTTTFLVKSVNKTNYDMEAKFDSLSMTLGFPQGSMEFNSANNDSDDVFSTILGAMIGKSFEVVMNKTGKVDEVNNIEVLWETAIDQFGEVPETQREQIKAQIMKAYGAEALKGNIEMVTAIYPDKPVNIGDKWTIKTNLESGMAAKMTTDYKFVDLNSDYALITGNSTITTKDKDAYVETNGMPMRFDLTGSMLSKIKVDLNTGWIIEASFKQEMKGNAYVKENPQLPDGMNIPITMINETTITNK